MKILRGLFTLFIFTIVVKANSQKLNPDVDLISEIVSQKQDEIKQRVLKNLVVKNIKTTNYMTYNTMYRIMETLTTEKNKTVMTKDLLVEIADYSVNYGLAHVFINQLITSDTQFKTSAVVPTNEERENPIYSYMLTGFERDIKDSVEITQKEKDSQKALLSNYIIDEMYKAIAKEESIKLSLKDNGLFDKNKLEKKFTYGINPNYDKLEPNLKVYVDKELKKFVKSINSLSETIDNMNLIQNGKFNLNINDLKSIKRDEVENLFNLFSFSLSNFEKEIGKNSFLAKIGSIIKKYVVYYSIENPDGIKEFKIDVEAIILSLEEEFYDKSLTSLKNTWIGVKPYFIIGLNHAIFTGDDVTILDDDASNSLTDVSFVGEKLGLKFVLADWKYKRSHAPLEWYKYRGNYIRYRAPQPEPLINDFYLHLFGSGILYNVVNLKSKDNFDFAIIGAGLGITFFNDMELNISYSIPIIENSLSSENSMINLGFDIPIFEYITAFRKKNLN